MTIELDQLTTLRRSLIDRAEALSSYIEDLQTDSGRSDDGFARALRLAHQYTRDLIRQVIDDSTRYEPDRVLQAHLESFLEREDWIDQRFARGRQRDVPRALKTYARFEFELHELHDHEPVLTVGAPDNFETYRVDLQEFLFEDLPATGPFESGKRLSIFSVPYIEGTRALWYPVVLGHEVAHTRLDSRFGNAGSFEDVTNTWLPRDADGALYGAAVEEVQREQPDVVAIGGELRKQLFVWACELVCDLNAVRLFGPAGLSSIGEFLTMLASQEEAGTVKPSSHPPLAMRLLVMSAYLRRLGFDGGFVPTHCHVWTEPQASAPGAGATEALLWQVLTDPVHVEVLIDLVEAWGDSYRRSVQRDGALDALVEALLDGLPGATHVLSDATWREVTVPDVVNAAWMAREVLDQLEAKQSSRAQADPKPSAPIKTGRALLDSGLVARDKRLRLDSLASKAIDSLELKRLWGEDREEDRQRDGAEEADEAAVVSPAEVRVDKNESAVAQGGGVLSSATIAKRLADPDLAPGQRLHVLPLFRDSVGDAAIDLRLGPDFIVFRHSATSVFDPIADQDPRQLQERVRKSWGEQFILHPQELVLAATLEYIVVPEDVAAQVITRSSYGRLGLITATAVQVQPGSRGCITLELVNHGETPIALTPGARVAQLMSWTVTEPTVVKAGKYWFPVGPEFSKVQDDRDRKYLDGLRKRAVPPAQADEPVPVRAAGSDAERELLEEILLQWGGQEMRLRREGDGSAPGVGKAALGRAALTIPLPRLSTALLRWLQGRAAGGAVERAEFGFVIRPDSDIPGNTLLFHDSDRAELTRVQIPRDSERDILTALRVLFHRSEG